MLLNNAWREAGLVNGATGKIHKIIYDENTKPPDLPRVVLTEIPQFKGQGLKGMGVDKIVPITPLTRTWNENKTACSRTTFPLVPAYAITIHKSQGQTLDQILLDLSM